MGASLVYLDKPNKDISHEEGEDGQLSFVASEMQGWRINMVSPMPHYLILDMHGRLKDVTIIRSSQLVNFFPFKKSISQEPL
jgi:hypothetical protein